MNLLLPSLLLVLATAAVPASARAPAIDTEVAQFAQRLLLEQAAREGLLDPTVEVVSVGSSRPAQACKEPVGVTAVDVRSPNRMRFAVTCPDTANGWRQEFVVRAEITAEVVVTTAAVPANRPLAPAELMLERRPIAATFDALSDISAVAGISSRRALRAGQVVQKQLLAAPVLVRRGEPVHILVRSGPVEVSASGEALEPGQRDDIVRVRNVSTGRIIRARVIEAATVEPVDMFSAPHSRD